ncbi:hypothetical protein Hanom_Chr15g01400111 [Helianthus anomalus]
MSVQQAVSNRAPRLAIVQETRRYTRMHTWHQSTCDDICSMISTKPLMTDETTRTTARPRGSIQRAPTSTSSRNPNGRHRRDKMDIPCC